METVNKSVKGCVETACLTALLSLVAVQTNAQVAIATSTLSNQANQLETEKDPKKWIHEEGCLETAAVPTSKQDIDRMELDLESNEEYRYRRAIDWIDRIENPALSTDLERIFAHYEKQLPGNSTMSSSELKTNAAAKRNEEILAHLMKKLSDLGDKCTPLFQAYTNQQFSEVLYLRAMAGLDKLREHSLSADDRHQSALAGYVDPKDEETKAWLKETMMHDPRIEVRRQAGTMFVEYAANPNSPEDIQFARDTLLTSKDLTDQMYGCRILLKRINAGYSEPETFDSAVRLLRTHHGNHACAIELLEAIGKNPTYRSNVLMELKSYIQSSPAASMSSKDKALQAIETLSAFTTN